MRLLLFALVSIQAFAQIATPLIVTPGAGTASSEIRLREQRSNGDNYFGWKSPAALASDVMLVGPTGYGSAGQALTTDGAGGTSWSTIGSGLPSCASATGNDTYTCTVSGFSSYTVNYCVVLKADASNTLAATVNISGGGTKSILRYGGSALATNDILANSPVIICYDGTQFQLPPSSSPGSGAWLNGGNSFGSTSSIGNNDNYDLQVKTNNLVRLTIGADGNLSFSGNATPLFDGLGSIGTSSYRYGAMFTYNLNASGTITFPTGAVAGYVWTSNGAGVGSWAAPGGIPVVDTTAIVKGSADATKLLRFEVDGFTTATTRVLTPQNADYTLAGINIAQTFSATQTFGANILFGSDNTYDVGATGTRARAVYSRAFDTAASGATGDYVQTRKLNLFDNTGSTSLATFWDLQCVVSGIGAFSESYCYMRDNSGNKVFQAERVRSGSAVDRTYWYTDLLPDTNLGQNLGSAANIWSTIYVDTIGTDLFPTTDNAKVLGNGTKRWASIRTVDFRADGSITFPTGAVSGYRWTSDASGVGSWQPDASSLPVVDTTGIAKGSVDPSKIVRFEVDGFTTATTRVLTPQNASYTLAGTDLAQTFTAAQTFNNTVNLNNGFSTDGNVILTSTRILSNITSVAQNWIPNLSSYELGSSETRWNKLWAAAVDVSGGLSANGNVGFGGNMSFSGTATPLFDSLGSIGSSAYKYGSVYAWSHYAYTGYYMGGTQVMDSSRNLTNISSITTSGSITPGGGVATTGGGIGGTGHNTYYGGTWYYGVAAQTLSVTDAGGGTCTITVYGGVITASTC